MRVYRRKYKDRHGHERTGRTWWLLAYVGGARFHQSLRTRDKRAAELIAADLMRREELKRAGIEDPFSEHHEKRLKEHVADFEKTLRARDVVERYLEDRMGCLRAFVEDAGAERLKDLSLPGASGFLSKVKAAGVSARTVNRCYQALKQFGLWLVRTRRVQFDPFDGLKTLNEEADRRHVRRALTPEEARAADRGGAHAPPVLDLPRQEGRAHLARLRAAGSRRWVRFARSIYALALGTGLRKGEIRRLRWCDVDLEPGEITVPAASAKSRRDQHLRLAAATMAHLAAARPLDASPEDPVVPRAPSPTRAPSTPDLEAAGIAREGEDGRVVDFHALRTTYISWLAAGGVHPSVAQQLARHASIETTMERYTDLSLLDTGRRRGGPAAARGAPRQARPAHLDTARVGP